MAWKKALMRVAFRCESLTLMGEDRALNIPRMGDLVLIDLGDGVFTRREPHNSHELHQTFQLYNYRSDTEHGMLVKPSVPPFKTRMPPCSSPFICRFRQIGFAVKSHGSHKKSKSSSWSPSYDWSDKAQTGNTKQQAAKTNSIQKLWLSKPWVNEMHFIV